MSKIEWTEATWNPIAGCAVVSPGCTNCYAMRLAGTRLDKHPKYRGLTQQTKAGPVWTGETRVDRAAFNIPLERKKPTRYFVNSMSDLFAESVSDEDILDILTIIAICGQHEFQVLTKRADRMREFMSNPDLLEDIYANWYSFDGGAREVQSWPLHNLWLGVSVEDKTRAGNRIWHLRDTPSAVRFLSCEPLLESLYGVPFAGLDWVIVGGESGPGRRHMAPDWAREIRDRCAFDGVPFFMKQMTGKQRIPDDLMIREWPKPTLKRGPVKPPTPEPEREPELFGT